MLSKIKEFVKKYQVDIILSVGVILISLLSFAIGYIVAKQQKEPLFIEQTNFQIQNERK
jgi:lipopolysaccharide/colanic/teichoic acid biosynthesis glycosyltransferase